MDNRIFDLDMDIIALKFGISGELVSFDKYGNGNINGTFIVEYENNSSTEKYILQKINTEVFKNPFELMKNIVGVTGHIRQYYAGKGIDSSRRTLEFLKCDKVDNACIAQLLTYITPQSVLKHLNRL